VKQRLLSPMVSSERTSSATIKKVGLDGRGAPGEEAA
jgi:hypothetical protein